MKKSLLAVPAVISAMALSLSGCAKAPDENGKSTSSSSSSSSATAAGSSGDFKACMVSDSGGFDDKSFNQTSHKGLLDAQKELRIQTGEVESKDTKDFATNIQSMVDAKCNIIVTVGFMLGDATVAAAKAHPDVNFAIVDWGDPKGKGIKNLKELVFNTAESSFEAGYVAASMTKSGKVGTFGGMKIPTVTIFMDGYAQGVDYYNKTKNKNVQVLGWDAAKQDGSFNPGKFEDVAGGKRTAQNLVSQGADIIFPVAGPAGQGALQVAAASGGKVDAIWVDTDGCVSAAQYCPSIITSAYKAMDVAVKDTITSAKEGKFNSEPYVGTLANDGTGLSPFHDFESKVPEETKKELETIKKDIIDGKIKIESKAQPAA